MILMMAEYMFMFISLHTAAAYSMERNMLLLYTRLPFISRLYKNKKLHMMNAHPLNILKRLYEGIKY